MRHVHLRLLAYPRPSVHSDACARRNGWWLCSRLPGPLPNWRLPEKVITEAGIVLERPAYWR